MSARKKYTKELLELVVKESCTWSEVCRKINVKPATGAQSHIKKRAIEFKIDFSHFVGQSWNRGRPSPLKRDIEDYLTNKVHINSHRLKLRLFKENLKEKRCEMCKLTDWCGEEICFELDHINNIHSDNSFDNLMIVCPNCHSLKTRKASMAKRQTQQF